jgi:signal transduction histidine kinase
MLRRHEKDYMLRKDTIYIQQLNGLSNNLLHNLSASSADFQHLKAYQKNFYVLTTLEAEIGVDEESGMRNQINAYREKIKLSLSLLLKSSKSIAIKIVEYGIKVFFVAMVSFLLITFWLGWDIWKNTARPLTLLTAISDDYHKTPSDISLKPFNCEVNEISKLHSSFINLIQDLEVLIERSNQANTELAEQNRRLTKINQELDMFVYSASHDLRAPMTSLMGLVQLCQGEEDQEECQSYYTFMQERIKELDRYIMDIIDYSRNNRQEMNIEQLDLEVLINETIQQYAYHENFKMMRIIKKVHCEEPCYNDGFRLGIIFKNLISNAIKYSDLDKEENTLNITIKVSQGYINMEFSDTGIGIPEDKTNRIFNIFFRAHAQSKGSGLGLYIVKETVEKIGGEITVSSKPGKGTIFKVRIKNCQLQTKNSLLVYA